MLTFVSSYTRAWHKQTFPTALCAYLLNEPTQPLTPPCSQQLNTPSTQAKATMDTPTIIIVIICFFILIVCGFLLPSGRSRALTPTPAI